MIPSNLIYIVSSGKQYFLLAEIFLETDSPEKKIKIELCNNKNLKEGLVPEFVKSKAKLTFDSNIYC